MQMHDPMAAQTDGAQSATIMLDALDDDDQRMVAGEQGHRSSSASYLLLCLACLGPFDVVQSSLLADLVI